MLATKGIAKGLAPLPEREAAHLGDAIAGPRTLLFSQPPQAAKDSIGKPCNRIVMNRNGAHFRLYWVQNAH